MRIRATLAWPGWLSAWVWIAPASALAGPVDVPPPVYVRPRVYSTPRVYAPRLYPHAPPLYPQPPLFPSPRFDAFSCTRTVERGDTLGRIAAETRTSVAWLARENDISDVDLIHVGQILRVPCPLLASAGAAGVRGYEPWYTRSVSPPVAPAAPPQPPTRPVSAAPAPPAFACTRVAVVLAGQTWTDLGKMSDASAEAVVALNPPASLSVPPTAGQRVFLPCMPGRG